MKIVTLAEMVSDLVHEFANVVVDRSAPPADYVEMVVRMGDLPSCRFVDSEM